MINKIKIISDSACDLPEDYLKEHDITSIPFYIMDNSDSEQYIVSVDKLYEEMLSNPNKMYKTACPSPETYFKTFKESTDKKIPVICVSISKEISGSFNSATLARTMILEENPSAQVAIIDSTLNSASQGLVVSNIQILRDRGLPFDEIVAKIEENKHTGKIAFFVDNLNYLEHGGRIGKMKSLVSKLLNIKPLIIMEKGNIHTGGMAIGIKKSVAKVIETISNSIKQVGDVIANYRFTVGYGANKAMGESLKTVFLEQFALNSAEVAFHQIGCTTAVHTGPHTYGVGMIKKV